eukprot:s135_g23.t1
MATLRREHEDRLFESEGSDEEPPPVRLEVMDTSQHPPRHGKVIPRKCERQTLQNAGILFNTEGTQATDWRSEVSSRAPRRDRQALQDAGVLFNTEGTQATDLRSEASSKDHFAI